jgi:tRNA(Ile)-lysidine synthase
MIDLFCAEADEIIDPCAESVCVAVSGGSDSMSLLVLTAEWAKKKSVKVYCVTVDHKLRKESGEEAQFVGNFCRSIGIDHTILEWNRENDYVAPGKLENLAREARYKLIADFCENNGIKFLLVGHTMNDQRETFEIRKNSGSSEIGLACMSRVRSLTRRVKLVRPLLNFTKNKLEDFLKNRNISWKTDPMNDQEFFLRVACRKKLKICDPQKLTDISNEIKRLGKKRNEIETAAVNFLKNFCNFSSEDQVIIERKQLDSEEKNVRAEILKRVIRSVGGKKYTVTLTEDICDKILCKKLNTIGRCLLKVKKDKIFVLRENRKNCRVVEHFDYINLFDVFL